MVGFALLAESEIRFACQGARGRQSWLLATGERSWWSGSSNLTIQVLWGTGRTAVVSRSYVFLHMREIKIGSRRFATGSCTRKAELQVQTPRPVCRRVPCLAVGSLEGVGQNREGSTLGHTDPGRRLVTSRLPPHESSGLPRIVQTAIHHLRHALSPDLEL